MAKTYPVPANWSSSAYINDEKYRALYERSVSDPDGFWGEQAAAIAWIKPFTKVKNTSFDPHNVSVKWYEDGTLNVCANCVDRHLAERGDQVAILWEGDEPDMDLKITYRQLHERVSRFANVLKKHGVKKGDRVTIYLPMIPEAAYAMLACARIGAIHSVVFGGFSPDSLASRILDCDSNLVITADEGVRGGRKVPLKANTDKALEKCPSVERVLVVKRTEQRRSMDGGPRFLARRRNAVGFRQLPAGGDERGRPAVHSLYLRLDRPAERRAAHVRRLSGLCVDYAPLRLRL